MRYLVLEPIVFLGQKLAKGRVLQVTNDSPIKETYGDKVEMIPDWVEFNKNKLRDAPIAFKKPRKAAKSPRGKAKKKIINK